MAILLIPFAYSLPPPHEQSTLTIQTDKQSYLIGEIIFISGTSKYQEDSVTIRFTLQSNSQTINEIITSVINHAYTAQWTIPANTPTGLYWVTVSILRPSGYQQASVEISIA